MWTTYSLPMASRWAAACDTSTRQARTVSNVPVDGGVFEMPSFTVVDLYARVRSQRTTSACS